eukprot:TRINITY_DN16824_c0_g1_i2.p1 TRINITY_DN16824_c0_g1~~TRINITY_DN16824_c0_g1_i2.p1  ORF type:complete len:375 (-),score=91.58 TRINITY_DN16824_c0_g1_i2:5-1129(-)
MGQQVQICALQSPEASSVVDVLAPEPEAQELAAPSETCQGEWCWDAEAVSLPQADVNTLQSNELQGNCTANTAAEHRSQREAPEAKKQPPPEEASSSDEAFVAALDCEQWNLLTDLAARGASLEKVDSAGATAIVRAAEANEWAVVEHLARHGAKLDAVNDCGKAVLALAAEEGNLESLRALLKLGAPVDARCDDGRNACACAAAAGHAEIVQELATLYGDCAHALDWDRQTPFSLAASAGHWEVVRVLAPRGIDLEVKNHVGRTAIALAVLAGELEVVKVLAACRADLAARDNKGHTVSALAVLAGKTEIMEALHSHGVPMEEYREEILGKPTPGLAEKPPEMSGDMNGPGSSWVRLWGGKNIENVEGGSSHD